MPEESTRHPSNNPTALPAGTRLGEFELLSLLGIGGFGIVYLAFDHALEREVAIKEYMPAALAGRTATMHVSIRSQSDAESFALGLRSFVNEARLLARFDHPSLLKVHRFWEGNGTAYMAMPVMRGRTVRDVRMDMPFPPDEAWMRALLDPLLGAIEKLHSEGVYHRDIAPDNIQIEPDGHPVLLDFGAARRVLTDKSQALTAILKPAYAPIEQYGEAGSVKQGPWTDIYALGATLHFLLLMRPPAPATARTIHDEASALTTQALPGYSDNFLRIIDWMLAPRPADRPQSVAALREVLEGRASTPMRRVAAQDAASDWDRTVIVPVSTATVAARTSLPPAPPPGPAVPVAAVWPPQDDYDADATVILPTPTRAHTSTRAMPPPPPPPLSPPPSPAPEAAYEPVQPTVRVPPPAAPVAAPPALPAATESRPKPPASSPPLAPQNGKSKLMPIALGVGALVLVAAAVFGLTRKSGADAAAPEIAASPTASPAPTAAPTVAPAAPVAESKVATVVVPAVAEPQTAPAATPAMGAAPAQVASGPAKSASASAATASKLAANKSAAAARAAASAQAAAVPVVVAPPPPAPVVDVYKPAPAPAAEAPKPVATNPEARCAGRSTLAYFVCMEQECLKSEQLGTADCKKWRRNARTD